MKGVSFIVARAWVDLSSRVLEKRAGSANDTAAQLARRAVKPEVFLSDTSRAAFRNSQRRT